MIFIIRSGVQILSDHPRLYWTRHSTPGKAWFRIQKPVPADPLWTAKQDSISLPGQIGLPGLRHSIGLARWWHLGVDTLWLLNGLAFYVLLFATGQWRRLVPTNWEVFPNAVSVAIQYLSLNWPTETGWVAYNSLQLIAYFVTVFVAAPLALITGLGMSPALSTRFKRISKVLSIQAARSLHFLVLVWFLLFIVIHVTLVFTTGLLRNLNHIYAGRNDTGWLGFWLCAASMVVVIVGWVAATPLTLRHPRVVQRVGFALIGPAQRLFEHLDATPGEYTERDISPYFWHNGQYPDSGEYQALFAGNFADYRLRINGLVDNPVELDLVQLRALPHHEQITQHFCIQGWSGIAKWGGVPCLPTAGVTRRAASKDGNPVGVPALSRLPLGAGNGLDGLPVAEELVVLVVAAIAATDVGEVGDELHAFDPLALLEAQLGLVAQPERGTVTEGQRRSVHVVGQHRQVIAHLLDGVGVVVDAFVGAVPEGVEDHPLRRGQRSDQVHDGRHRHPAPLGDARPSLDAEVLGGLLVVGQRPELDEVELDRVVDQTVA